MKSIEEIVTIIKTNSVSRPDVPGDDCVQPMVFSCSAANESAAESECDNVTQGRCPSDLKRFWKQTCTAKLFEDTTYQDWGVEVFSPQKTLEETSRFHSCRSVDTLAGDLVIGRLIGDSDLLVLRTDPEQHDFGNIILAGPIDPRADWQTIAASFEEFLNRYIDARGSMYWTET